MKIFNSPAQAKNLREIEDAAISRKSSKIKETREAVQPVYPIVEKEAEEVGTEAQTEAPAQKTRTKKNTKKI